MGCQQEEGGQRRRRAWSPAPGLRRREQVGGTRKPPRLEPRPWAAVHNWLQELMVMYVVGGGRGGALKSQNLLVWLKERMRPPTVYR